MRSAIVVVVFAALLVLCALPWCAAHALIVQCFRFVEVCHTLEREREKAQLPHQKGAGRSTKLTHIQAHTIADRLTTSFTNEDGALLDTNAALIPQHWGYGPYNIFKKRGVLNLFVYANCGLMAVFAVSSFFRHESSNIWNLIMEARYMIVMSDITTTVTWFLWAYALYDVPKIPGHLATLGFGTRKVKQEYVHSLLCC